MYENINPNFYINNRDDIYRKVAPYSYKQIDTHVISGLFPGSINMYKNTPRERAGYVFITRPQLNLLPSNLKRNRVYNTLVNSNPLSMERVIRTTLDPRLQTVFNLRCDLVDPYSPFINLLSNTIKSLSGFPDLVNETYSSQPGLRKETHVIVDGQLTYYQEFDLDATFNNTIMEPIMRLFYIWGMYMADVFDGTCIPYVDFLARNEIDYNTRIWRIVTDESDKYVSKILATGASFPTTVPVGNWADYNNESLFQEANSDISIRFKSMGMTALDTILIHEFNRLMCMFHPVIRQTVEDGFEPTRAADKFFNIPKQYLNYFPVGKYPYISEDNELCWIADLNDKKLTYAFDVIGNITGEHPKQFQNGFKKPNHNKSTRKILDDFSNLV